MRNLETFRRSRLSFLLPLAVCPGQLVVIVKPVLNQVAVVSEVLGSCNLMGRRIKLGRNKKEITMIIIIIIIIIII